MGPGTRVRLRHGTETGYTTGLQKQKGSILYIQVSFDLTAEHIREYQNFWETIRKPDKLIRYIPADQLERI